MRSLQRARRGWKRYVFSKFTIVLLLVFAIYMVNVVWGMYGRYTETKREMTASAVKLQDEKNNEQHLKQKISQLETETGRETALRQKFLVAKEGEHVLVLVPDANASTSKAESPAQKSWWQKFLSIF